MYFLYHCSIFMWFFFFQAEDGIRDIGVTGVQTCALPISARRHRDVPGRGRRRVAEASRPRLASSPRLRPRRRDGGPRGALRMSRPAPGRAATLLDSFNYAFEGIIHVLRTQRNLRLHFLAAILVFAAAIALGVSRLQLIALVLVAEMLNTAIEGVIDLSTTSFDPHAKLAKDIAAGAVLIASIAALGVGYLVFEDAAGTRGTRVLDRVRNAPATVTLVSLVLVVLLVIVTKAWTGRGTPLRGGWPSGHAALAFAGWVAVTYLVGDHHRFLVSSLSLIMALLVAQTRLESGIHSFPEVALGGAVGALVTLAIFQAVS